MCEMLHFTKWLFEEETRCFSLNWQPQNESVLHRVLSQSHCPAAPHWRQVGTVIKQHVRLYIDVKQDPLNLQLPRQDNTCGHEVVAGFRLTGSGLFWSKTSCSFLSLLQVQDRRRTEAPAWRQTSGWDVHARGDKAGSVHSLFSCWLKWFQSSLIRLTLKKKCFHLKASEQIRTQSTKSSSIILALTDGKLDVYIHELTKNEVSSKQSFFFKIIFLLLLFNTTVFKRKSSLHFFLHGAFNQPVTLILHVCSLCRPMRPGNTVLVFTVWVLRTLMSSR